nr:energy transducer TonB [uncultured Enterobacter sp.]
MMTATRMLTMIVIALLGAGCSSKAKADALPQSPGTSMIALTPVANTCGYPIMPAKAAALRISGSVHFHALVNDEGRVTAVDTSGDELFYKTTQLAIKKCQFAPGKSGVYSGDFSFTRESPPGAQKNLG